MLAIFFSILGLIMLSSHLLWVWLKCVRKGYNWLSYAKFCAFYFGSIMQYCPTFSMQLRLISLETQYSYLKIFRFSCAFYIALYHCSSTSIRLLPSSASVNFNFNFKLEAEIPTQPTPTPTHHHLPVKVYCQAQLQWTSTSTSSWKLR